MDSLNTYPEPNALGATSEANSTKSDLVQKIKTSLYRQERDRLIKVMKQVRRSTEKQDFFNNLVKIVRHEFQADRVLIYRFNSEDAGQVVAETIVPGWTPAIDKILSCNCFGAFKASDFSSQGVVAIDNSNHDKATPYQKQLFEKFQVQASLALPILIDSFAQNTGYELSQTWGLLVVQQCDRPRQWQEDEINLLYQLTAEITRVLQSSTNYLKTNEEDLGTATTRLLSETLQEIRETFKGDKPDGMASLRSKRMLNPSGATLT